MTPEEYLIKKGWIVKLLESLETVTAEDLANFCSIPETQPTSPITRTMITELIDEGHLIGSNRKGYFLMTNAKQVQQVLNGLLRRQMGISRRIQSIYDAAQGKGIL